MMSACPLGPVPPVELPTYEELGLQKPVFHIPSTNNRVENFNKEYVINDAESTRVFVHERYLDLVRRFLEHKRKHGSSNEKRLFNSNWTVELQIRRLITNRTFASYGNGRRTLYTAGMSDDNSRIYWSDMRDENAPYEEFEGILSWDEILLGSLLGISGRSYFINDGSRDNGGELQDPTLYEGRGFMIGLAGPSIDMYGFLDSQFIDNFPPLTEERGLFARIFLDFFGVKERSNAKFDVGTYIARMRITADMLLLEANERAKNDDTKAYVHVVGLGLGRSKTNEWQPAYFVQAFYSSLAQLEGYLGNISVLDFSWIDDVPESTRNLITEIAALQNIRVTFSHRNPAAKLQGDDAGSLLVVSYPLDGNAFPGNEFWDNELTANSLLLEYNARTHSSWSHQTVQSGASAAAYMSTIAELQNPLINPGFANRIVILK